MRIIVTRPLEQAEATVAALQQRGLDAVALPLIDILPLQEVQPLQQAWRALDQFACVMFVSANAVVHFMRQRPPQVQWPVQVLAASTGPGTAAALLQAGVPRQAVVAPGADQYDSEALWLQLKTHDWAARRVLVVRGEGGRDWLAEQLAAAGASVQFVAAYVRALPSSLGAGQAVLDRALANPAEHLWAFSSSQALGHLQHLAAGANWSKSRAVAAHPRVAASARRLGFARVDVGPLTPQALAAAVQAAPAGHLQSGAP